MAMENAPELFSILLKLQQMEGTEERAGLIMIRISDLLNLSVTSQPAEMILKVDVTIASVS